MSHKVIKVAIGLIYQSGKLLVGWRDENLHQGGCYEFPGGKVEPNEKPEDAVIRELEEETGLKTKIIRLFKEEYFEYPDRKIYLYFYICKSISIVDENVFKKWQFVELNELPNLSFPAANTPIIQRLSWGKYLSICTNEDNLPAADVELCYIKFKTDVNEVLKAKLQQLIKLNKKVVLNIAQYENLDSVLKSHIFAVHLNSAQLHKPKILDRITNDKNIIAACHNEHDVQQANQIGCDAILLSPVHATPTHPDQDGIGWDRFKQLAQIAQMPVYALGGVMRSNLNIATANGAYGVAGIRDFITL